MTIDFVPRKPPRLIMLDDAGDEVEYIHLKFMTTEECHKLVQSKGFTRRADAGPIPDMSPIPESGAKPNAHKEWRQVRDDPEGAATRRALTKLAGVPPAA